MNWKEWTAVAVVIGGGILLQIPVPMDSMDMGGVDGGAMQQVTTSPSEGGAAEAATEVGPYRTVALDVTGMT